MALSDILAAIATVLTGAGAQNVHTYRPIIIKGAQITADLKSGNILNFWAVTRSATGEEWASNLETQRQHTLDCYGHLEVAQNGATEATFQALVEVIMAALRPMHRLPAPARVELLGPPQANDMAEPRMLAETYLIHYVHIVLRAQELVRH